MFRPPLRQWPHLLRAQPVAEKPLQLLRYLVSRRGMLTSNVAEAAAFVRTRPDVAALFPNSPQNTRAGWGYLMLTNFLPGLGNGTFTLTTSQGAPFQIGTHILSVDVELNPWPIAPGCNAASWSTRRSAPPVTR